jgi:site-specific recombinase XerD
MNATGDERLLARVRVVARSRRLSARTAGAYRWWIVRFVRFCELRHPSTVDASECRRFLDWLVTERRATPSTSRQARASLVFLYRDVLGLAEWRVPKLPKTPRRISPPEVLAPDEVARLLAAVAPARQLAVSLRYGTGLRLMAGATLRGSDVDIGRRRIRIRGDDGTLRRFALLPDALRDAIAAQVDAVRRQHMRDTVSGGGYVKLLASGRAVRDWRWTWLFPAARQHMDRASGQRRRHHVNPTTIQRAVSRAGRAAGLTARVTPRMLRHSYAMHLLRTGSDARDVQDLLGHRDLSTTLEYLRPGEGSGRVRSPLDVAFERRRPEP